MSKRRGSPKRRPTEMSPQVRANIRKSQTSHKVGSTNARHQDGKTPAGK